jgi:transcriptional regulator with XRE-family HTH domain
MAEKGAKSKLYEVAFRMYAEGQTLEAISEALGVSRQSLSSWKAETRRPNEDQDDWDKARAQKSSNMQRLKNLFDRELLFAEERQSGAIPQPTLNTLTQLGALVQRWETVERAASAGGGYDRPKVFLENLQFIAGWLRDNDPEGLKALAESFDPLTLAFKEECLNVNA